MAVPQCTVTGSAAALFGDLTGDGTLNDEDYDGLRVVFTPNVSSTELLPIDGVMRTLEPVEAVVDDGVLKRRNEAGSLVAGVKLLANGPEVAFALEWTVSFPAKQYRLNGFIKSFTKWSFVSPVGGETKDLSELPRLFKTSTNGEALVEGAVLGQMVSTRLDTAIPDALDETVPVAVTENIESRPTSIITDPDNPSTHIKWVWGDAVSPGVPGNATTFGLVHDRPEIDLNYDFAGTTPGSDVSTQLQQALTELSDGQVLRISKPGEYGISSLVSSVGKSVHIDAAGVKLVQAATGNMLSIAGAWETTYTVSSFGTALGAEDGQTPVTVFTMGSDPGWERGDIIKVFGEEQIPGTRSTSATTKMRVGQQFEVYSADGTTITCVGRPLDPMVTNVRAARLAKHTATLKGVRFESEHPETFTSGIGLQLISLYKPQVDVSFASMGNIVGSSQSCWMPTVKTVVDCSNDDNEAGILGYGWSESASQYGFFDIQAGFVRHAYNDGSPDITTAITDPTRYGRPYGHNVKVTAVGTTGGAIGPHSSGRGHTFHVKSYGCAIGATLRGIDHTLYLEADHCPIALTIIDEDWYDPTGYSYGHKVPLLDAKNFPATANSTDAAVHIASDTNSDFNGPSYPARQTRPIYFGKVILDGVVASRAFRTLNQTVRADDVTVIYGETLANNSVAFYTNNADMEIKHLDLDYTRNTAGNTLVPFRDFTKESTVRLRGGKIRSTGAAARIQGIVYPLSSSTVYDITGLETDEVLTTFAGVTPGAGSVIDWRSASGDRRGFISATNSAITSGSVGTQLAQTRDLKVTAVLSPTSGDFTLPALPAGNVLGQTLTITNGASPVTGFALSLAHGGTVLNMSNGTVALKPRESATWEWGGTSWRQTAAPRRDIAASSTTSSATPSINCELFELYSITALAVAITSVTVTGTPRDGQRLRVRIKGTGTRSIAWGSSFTGALLATTSGTNTHIQDLMYDATAAKWVGTYADTTGYA